MIGIKKTCHHRGWVHRRWLANQVREVECKNLAFGLSGLFFFWPAISHLGPSGSLNKSKGIVISILFPFPLSMARGPWPAHPLSATRCPSRHKSHRLQAVTSLERGEEGGGGRRGIWRKESHACRQPRIETQRPLFAQLTSRQGGKHSTVARPFSSCYCVFFSLFSFYYEERFGFALDSSSGFSWRP